MLNKDLQALWPWSVHRRPCNQVRPISFDFFRGRYKSQIIIPVLTYHLEIKDQMTFRNQLFRRYRQNQNADVWKAHKEAWRSVKQVLKNADCDHIRTEVQSHKDNPGSLWKIINTCISSQEKETPIYSRDTEIVANDFNQFFASVGRDAAQTAYFHHQWPELHPRNYLISLQLPVRRSTYCIIYAF